MYILIHLGRERARERERERTPANERASKRARTLRNMVFLKPVFQVVDQKALFYESEGMILAVALRKQPLPITQKPSLLSSLDHCLQG